MPRAHVAHPRTTHTPSPPAAAERNQDTIGGSRACTSSRRFASARYSDRPLPLGATKAHCSLTGACSRPALRAALQIFTTLFQHVEQLALERGDVRKLRLYVERTNAAAQRTYAKLGMVHSHYDMYEKDVAPALMS